MSPRPKLGSVEVGRLKRLVAQPSDDSVLPKEARAAHPASTFAPTSQSHLAFPAALAVLLESGPPSNPAHRLLAPGTSVGRYEIVRLLGAGGMGMVYEAIDPLLQRRIALKLLKNRFHDDSERALSEARALAQITHQNVVTAFDVGQKGEFTYVAMELIAGASLRRQLGIWARPWEQIKSTVLQVGRALEAAHAAGLVHCDVKPDNVLVDVHGQAYVADFGLARCFLPAGSLAEPIDESQERKRWFGTPGYVAPELIEGCDPSPRTDQFSYCVMVVEALIGLAPETEQDSPVPIREHLVTHLARAAAPGAVKRALLRGLAPTPEDRFSDMSVLLRALASPTRRHVLPIGVGLTTIALGGVWFSGASSLAPAEAQSSHAEADSSVATSIHTPTQSPALVPARPSSSLELVFPSRHTEPAPQASGLLVPHPASSAHLRAPTPFPTRRVSSFSGVATPPPKTRDTETSPAQSSAAATTHPQRPFGPRK